MSQWRGSGRALSTSGWEQHIGELSVREAAAALGVSESTISRARRSGEPPRAMSDPQRAADLQRAWSAYRHTNRFREVKTAAPKSAAAIRAATSVAAHGRQGPSLGYDAKQLRDRQIGGDHRKEGQLQPQDAERMAEAFERGGDHALALAVSEHFRENYWTQDHGGPWIMKGVGVTIGDFSAVLSANQMME